MYGLRKKWSGFNCFCMYKALRCKSSRWMKKKQKQWREMNQVKLWIPKACIIRVFLDCHDLYCIISQPFNSWQHLISEVSIRVYLWFLCNKSSNILSLSSSTDDHNLLYWNFNYPKEVKNCTNNHSYTTLIKIIFLILSSLLIVRTAFA